MRERLWLLLPAAALGLFVVAGLLLIPLLGYQTDEVMFIHGLWLPKTGVAWFSFYHHYMPSMLMSYVGALKSWLYAPLLFFFTPNVWVVRVPVLLLAAATIALAGRFLLRQSGRAAATTGILLLSFDSGFLLTSVFDWGPVVLQNSLLVAILVIAERWYRVRTGGLLFALGLLTGWALWNKALFLWNLSGLLLALVLFYWQPVRSVLSVRRLLILSLGLFLGAYPLIRYNLKSHGATLHENARLQLTEVRAKARLLRLTLDGEPARDALIERRIAAPDTVPRPFASAALAVELAAGLEFPTWGFTIGLLLLAAALLLGTPPERRKVAFFLLAGLLAWVESALTANAGNSLHHTALFLVKWYCAVALAAGVLWNRRGPVGKVFAAAAVALVAARSLLAVDATYAHLLEFESGLVWTNAEKQFVDDLVASGVKRVITSEWGLSDVVTVRSLNRIAIDQQAFALDQHRFDIARFQACVAPACAVVGHPAARALSPAATLFLKEELFHAGAAVEEKVYRDTHARPALTVLRLSFPSAPRRP